MGAPRGRNGSGTHAEYAHRRWEDAYLNAIAGDAPGDFDADEYREYLEELGQALGYLDKPSEEDRLGDDIRRGARNVPRLRLIDGGGE